MIDRSYKDFFTFFHIFTYNPPKYKSEWDYPRYFIKLDSSPTVCANKVFRKLVFFFYIDFMLSFFFYSMQIAFGYKFFICLHCTINKSEIGYNIIPVKVFFVIFA